MKSKLVLLLSSSLLLMLSNSSLFAAMQYGEEFQEMKQSFQKRFDTTLETNLPTNGNGGSLQSSVNQNIKERLSNSLNDNLNNKTYDSTAFENNISNEFMNGFKEETTKFINNDEFLNSGDKKRLINDLSSMFDFSSISKYFENVDITYADDEGNQQKWGGGDSISDSAQTTEESGDQTQYSFNCQCSNSLENAFDKMHEHIIVNNLEKIPDAIDAATKKVKENIEATKDATAAISKQKKSYLLRIYEAKKYLEYLKLELGVKKD